MTHTKDIIARSETLISQLSSVKADGVSYIIAALHNVSLEDALHASDHYGAEVSISGGRYEVSVVRGLVHLNIHTAYGSAKPPQATTAKDLLRRDVGDVLLINTTR